MCTCYQNNVLTELETAQLADGSSNSSSRNSSSSSSTAQNEKKTDGSRANISCSGTQSKCGGPPKGGSTAAGGKFMLQFPPGKQYIPRRIHNPGNIGTEWVLKKYWRIRDEYFEFSEHSFCLQFSRTHIFWRYSSRQGLSPVFMLKNIKCIWILD